MRAFLRETFLTRTKREWIEALRGHDLPFAPVQSLPEVLEDAHFRARGAVVADERGWEQIASPIRFTEEPGRERFKLPALGQHSQAVLESVGYTAAAIAALEAQGGVKAPPC